MTSKEAEQTLSVIRTLMERSTLYTNVSGHAGIAAGAVALMGCAARTWWQTPFLPTWLTVLAAACATTIFFTAKMAMENGEPLWTRQARTVVLALLPSLLMALVLSLVLSKAGQETLLPGTWMLVWGVGALSMGFFTPRILSVLGATFMAAGTFTLFISPVDDGLAMGLTFGVIHLAYGTVLLLARHWSSLGRPVLRH